MTYLRSDFLRSRVTAPILVVFAGIGSVLGRGDGSPPSSDKAWLPPKLSDYENQLAGRRFHEAKTGSRVSINPRKTYNLAELIDIAERNNPETRRAWARAAQGR